MELQALSMIDFRNGEDQDYLKNVESWFTGAQYKNGLRWEWQAIDGAMTKAPLGGAGTGANPTDRGKKGTKRSILQMVKVYHFGCCGWSQSS